MDGLSRFMDSWWVSELKQIRIDFPKWSAKLEPPPNWERYSEKERLAVRRWVEKRQADEIRFGLSGDWEPW